MLIIFELIKNFSGFYSLVRLPVGELSHGSRPEPVSPPGETGQGEGSHMRAHHPWCPGALAETQNYADDCPQD